MTINEFFQAPLSQVNGLLLLMALHHGGEGPPEWARTLTRLEELPRFSTNLEKLKHSGNIDFLRDREIARRVRWVVENLDGAWSLEKAFGEPSRLLFEVRTEAVRYAIRFAAARPPL